MGLFSRTPSALPETTYGYAPPPEATASGWQCNNDGCNRNGQPVPSRWPFTCPHCGNAADPDFDEPWREEAVGPRIQMFIDREGDSSGIFGATIHAWNYGRALRAGDDVAASEALDAAHVWIAEVDSPKPSSATVSARSGIVRHAIANGRYAIAASELSRWYEALDFEHVDVATFGTYEGETAKIASRSLVRASIGFLTTPAARQLPEAPVIDRQLRQFAQQISTSLGSAQEDWIKYATTPAL